MLYACIVIATAMVWLLLPQTTKSIGASINSFSDVPFIGFAFPLIGLFIAPIYPLLNSAVLNSLPKHLHSHMTGLIVIFSALGGSLGSRAIGYLFDEVGGDSAFYYLTIPLVALFICIYFLNKLTTATNEE